MMDDALVCTSCNDAVILNLSYDGLVGRCSCSFMSMAPGGEKPYSWERYEDVKSPQDFAIKPVRDTDELEYKLLCARCNDGDNVSVELEHDAPGDLDVRAEVTCDAEHGMSDRENTSVAYYNEGDHKLEALQEYTDE
jgi:hypothetical protein